LIVSNCDHGEVIHGSKSMGAKSPGGRGKGKGKGKKGGGNGPPPNGGQLYVTLKVSDARTLLGSLATGNPPPQAVAKAVSLALVRALNAGPITYKKSAKTGKTVVGKKGAPVVGPKKGAKLSGNKGAPPGRGKKGAPPVVGRKGAPPGMGKKGAPPVVGRKGAPPGTGKKVARP
jgi:hypothetical protein